ncbi:transposase family protein [Nonomuraea sp. NPDC004354]
MKAMVLTDAHGAVLYCGQVRPGSVADITQARQSGLLELLSATQNVEILADAGYQGLSSQTGGQVVRRL